MKHALFRFELSRCLREGLTLRAARIAALAYARAPLPF